MAFKSLNCPNCGGKIETFDDKITKGICPYCDSIIVNVKEEQEGYLSNQEKVNSEAIENYYALGKTALESREYHDVIKYSNKIIELNGKNASGWYLKALGTGWMITIEENKFSSVMQCFEKALHYSEGEFNDEIINNIKELSLCLIELYGNNFADNPNDNSRIMVVNTINTVFEEITKFQESTGIVLEELNCQLQLEIPHIINTLVINVYKKKKIAFGNTLHGGNAHLWVKYVKSIESCSKLINDMCSFDIYNTENRYIMYQNIVAILENLLAIQGEGFMPFNKDEILAREKVIMDFKEKENKYNPELIRARELQEERERRYRDYWQEHKEERKQLEEELKEKESALKNLGIKGRLGITREAKELKRNIENIIKELNRER